MTNIEPLGDRVAVLPDEAEQVTASGIVIPDTAKEQRPQEGTVMAIGKGGIKAEGKEVSNPQDYLKIGDKVLFGKYAGDDVTMKDENGKDMQIKVLPLAAVLGKLI